MKEKDLVVNTSPTPDDEAKQTVAEPVSTARLNLARTFGRSPQRPEVPETARADAPDTQRDTIDALAIAAAPANDSAGSGARRLLRIRRDRAAEANNAAASGVDPDDMDPDGTDPDGVDPSGGYSAVLEVSGLACAAGRRTVLTNASFTVLAGEIVGIVGPNGSGKTTLLRTIAGLIRPVHGEVRVDGVGLHGLSARKRARTVALVAQDEMPSADLLAGEVVALGRTPYLPPWGAGEGEEREAVEEALRAVDLAGFAGRPVHQLSGGERQRVLLARALVQDTPLLLMDEPTNHLDITHQLDLLALARDLGRTVVLSLHDLALADRYCDRVLVLHKGRARPLAPPAVALRPEVLDAVFGVRATRVPHPDTGIPHLLITARSHVERQRKAHS